MHVDYQESKQRALKLILILGGVTIFEVFVALLGKGYISPSVHMPQFLMVLLMVAMSAFKAYAIVKEFMHMGYEVKSFAMSVVLPMLLLVWAIIAFLWEGDTWGYNRGYVLEKREAVEIPAPAPAETPAVPLDTAGVKKDTLHEKGSH